MTEQPAPAAPASKPQGPKVTAALIGVKAALLAGTAIPENLVRAAEDWYRAVHKHASVPTPLAMVLAFSELTAEERERLNAIKHGEDTTVREGGPGHPVGPGKEPAPADPAKARQKLADAKAGR